MILNETPVRTSKNFEINNIKIDNLEMPQRIEDFNNLTITGDIENFQISDNTAKLPLIYGINKQLEQQIYEKSNQDIKIVIDTQTAKNIYLDFEFDDENINLIENIEIIANQNSKATIIVKYISKEQEPNYHNGIVRVTAEEGSCTNVIIVNMLNDKSNNFISIENTIYDNAELNYTIVDFGGKNSVSNYYSNLIGKNSKNNLNTIYLGKEDQLFDINYIAELRGEKSNANIEVQGALKDVAKKNFKGTIDFKKGCKNAIGSENEFCMLLSDKSRSKALPMLLCTEENVEGSHSTASGKVDNSRLFYIMSRGFSYKEAMKLIVKANFNGVINTITDEKLREFILNEIDDRLD